MASVLLESGLGTLRVARHWLLETVRAVPADKLCWQPFAGANHAMWNAGHCAASDDFFVSTLGGVTSGLPAGWKELFGGGSTPVGDPGKYPRLEEVLGVLASRRGALETWFGGQSDAQLLEALPEDWRTFAPNKAVLMGAIAWHEGTHTGQIHAVRKALGLKPVMM